MEPSRIRGGLKGSSLHYQALVRDYTLPNNLTATGFLWAKEKTRVLTRPLGLLALLTMALLACSTSANGLGDAGGGENQSLTVFAASSLTEGFLELGSAFEREHPGASVIFNFAGSQRLRTQLEQGARADVFASADWKQMRSLVESGLVLGEPVNFVSNHLVVIVPSPRRQQEGSIPWPVGARSDMVVSKLEDLARPGIKLVLASPEVPVGAYSHAVIQKMAGDTGLGPGYAESVLANLVSEETNVRNVAQKVSLGEADAGMVYRTDAMISGIAQQVEVIPIPAVNNVTASYPVAVMKEAGEPGLAQDFVRYLQSETAQHIFSVRGFGPPDLLLPTSADTMGRTDR